MPISPAKHSHGDGRLAEVALKSASLVQALTKQTRYTAKLVVQLRDARSDKASALGALISSSTATTTASRRSASARRSPCASRSARPLHSDKIAKVDSGIGIERLGATITEPLVSDTLFTARCGAEGGRFHSHRFDRQSHRRGSSLAHGAR
ncbi:hypothetical protein [Mesorhizobium shangrilense]|uniref:Uncharacterized protein n=1 Tax=Mesorhizobium shangrilense TaxID=460060 RepID=A0ABV2DM48_9HYPH